jgi:hypothetical protein
MSMIALEGKTIGLDIAAEELGPEVMKNAVPNVTRAAKAIRDRIQRNISRMGPPSPPGSYPARVTGHLFHSIGSSRAELTGSAVTAFVGVGAGADGRAGAAAAKADGVNIFAEANSLEFGSVTKTGMRRSPRPFVRPTINEMEAGIVAMLERG